MCNIQNIQLAGENLSAGGPPSDLIVSAQVDCSEVTIEVRRNSSDVVAMLRATGVTGTAQSDAQLLSIPAYFVWKSFPLVVAPAVQCGDLLFVTIICSENCSRSEPSLVQCKGVVTCPSNVTYTIDPPVDQSADCIPAGHYLVTVTDPVGPTVTYYWSSGPVGGSQTNLPGNGPTQNIQVNDGDPAKIVTIMAIKAGCAPPPPASIIFPAGHDTPCPSGFTVFVDQGTALVAGPHTDAQGINWNVPPVPLGTYTLRITPPLGGGETYEWYNNDGSLAATGPSNLHDVAVATNASTTISFRIKPSECCNPTIGFVTLTGTASSPPVEEPPPIEPAPVVPDAEITGDSPTAPSFNFCAILDYLLGISLIVALVAGVAAGCSALFQAAMPALIVAVIVAVVAVILMALICGPSLCHIVGIFVWALKWAIVVGAVIAIGCVSILSAFVVVLFGGLAATLIWALIWNGCPVPRLLGPPAP